MNPLPQQDIEQMHQVFLGTEPTGYTCVAEYYKMKNDACIYIRLLNTLDLRKKAVILSRAVFVSAMYYKMFQGLVIPRVDSYSFRPGTTTT